MSSTTNGFETWSSIIDDANRFTKSDGQPWTFLVGDHTRPVQAYGLLNPIVVSYLKVSGSKFFTFDSTWREVRLQPETCNSPLDFTRAFVQIRQHLSKTMDPCGGRFPNALLENIDMIPLICAPIRRFDEYRGCSRAGIPRDIAPLFGVTVPSVHVNIYSQSGEEMKLYLAVHPSRSPYPWTTPRNKPDDVEIPWIRYFDFTQIVLGTGPQVDLLPKPGMLKPYDLKLGPGARLKARDGICSIEAFSVEQVKDFLVDRKFKPESALVVLDFLIRHKLVGDSNGDREKLNIRLRRDLGLPFDNHRC
ncbi:thiamine pyrophosphokinase [Colletotrichum higginsianum]|nr:thiamine pyrophosphokinase [Colletotrichum higginsianum]